MDDERYSDIEEEASFEEDAESLEPQPYWTVQRIIFTLLVLLMLLAFLAYSLQGLFIQPPPPLPPPRSLPMV
jgi:quinol-cytochrome oxidoreductase complex cytochrome b subunit